MISFVNYLYKILVMLIFVNTLNIVMIKFVNTQYKVLVMISIVNTLIIALVMITPQGINCLPILPLTPPWQDRD